MSNGPVTAGLSVENDRNDNAHFIHGWRRHLGRRNACYFAGTGTYAGTQTDTSPKCKDGRPSAHVGLPDLTGSLLRRCNYRLVMTNRCMGKY